jgi:hypothetical protein
MLNDQKIRIIFICFIQLALLSQISKSTRLYDGVDAELNAYLNNNQDESENHEEDYTYDIAIKLKEDFSDDLVSDLFAASYGLEKIAKVT